MRVIGTAAVALIAALLVGSAVAVALAEWVAADESYIIAFITVLPVSMIATAAFLLAGAVAAEPRRGFAIAGKLMLGSIFVLLAIACVLEIVDGAGGAITRRAMRFHAALALSWFAIVATQWLIFRWRTR